MKSQANLILRAASSGWGGENLGRMTNLGSLSNMGKSQTHRQESKEGQSGKNQRTEHSRHTADGTRVDLNPSSEGERSFKNPDKGRANKESRNPKAQDLSRRTSVAGSEKKLWETSPR